MNHPELHQKTLLFLLIAISLAFGWILWPFYGAVFWGGVFAIIFAPLYRRLLELVQMRRNLAAALTLLLCLFMVILPLTVITLSLIEDGAAFYQRARSGNLDLNTYFEQTIAALPTWMINTLERLGVTNMAALQQKLSSSFSEAGQFIASKAVSIGQNTFNFVISLGVMLYLLFFLLRDGAILADRIKYAIPLSSDHKRHLFRKFTTVIRATVKGNIAVAATQGFLGGLIFWILGLKGALLWGVAMAFLSLLPAIGAALIWGPAAIYLMITGELGKGITLIVFGVVVIGLVDNILRPILVGKDTQMPDYVVLISTIGGMSLFGLNGFVIGPVIAALFIAAWDLFAAEKDSTYT